MSIFEQIIMQGGCRAIGFSGDSLGTSAVTPDDFVGNEIAYPCKGLRLFNANSDKTLYYSFDGMHWLSVPPLGELQIARSFDALYLKASGSGAVYEGEVAKAQ